ncbi:MAG: type II toxin-antitoxin system PemK/MazF family toxin [Geminicoccaceae bacterium]
MLVVSPAAFNRVTRVPVVLPITSGGSFARGAGFAVSLSGAGTQTTGVVRCDQPRALDLKARAGAGSSGCRRPSSRRCSPGSRRSSSDDRPPSELAVEEIGLARVDALEDGRSTLFSVAIAFSAASSTSRTRACGMTTMPSRSART